MPYFEKLSFSLSAIDPISLFAQRNARWWFTKTFFAHHVNTINYYYKWVDGKMQNKSGPIKEFLDNSTTLGIMPIGSQCLLIIMALLSSARVRTIMVVKASAMAIRQFYDVTHFFTKHKNKMTWKRKN